MSGPDARLGAALAAEAGPYGLQSIEASFIAAKELSLRWSTGRGELRLWASDYLADAPTAALDDFAVGALGLIYHKQKAYGRDYLDYVTSDEFVIAKRPIYLRRSRNLTRSDRGRRRCLFDAAQRLLDLDLIGPNDLDNALLTWTAGANFRRLGYCSPVMKVVAISSVFDRDDVPEYLLDYVVYHECLHLRQGYRPFVRRFHDAEFRRQERLYPRWQEAEQAFLRLPRNSGGRGPD